MSLLLSFWCIFMQHIAFWVDFFFSVFLSSFYYLLASIVSDKKVGHNWCRCSSVYIVSFSPEIFKVFSLSLIFSVLTMMFLNAALQLICFSFTELFGSIRGCFSPNFEKISNHYFMKFFFCYIFSIVLVLSKIHMCWTPRAWGPVLWFLIVFFSILQTG